MSTVDLQEISLLRSRISHLGIKYVEQNSPDDPRIVDALRKNNMIEAIKYDREINDIGLAEAKAAVEAIRARHGI